MTEVKVGQINQLRVVKEVDHGFYLQGDETWGEILLPRKLAENDTQIDDDVDVFIYFDSQDRIVATPQRPIAQVGEFALLKVTTETDFGVFMDWGLDKDLLVPLREQLFKMQPGQAYVVYIYIDKSGRIAGSTRISNKLDHTHRPDYKVNQEVDLLIYQETDMGLKAIVDGQYSGLIYKDEVRGELGPGQQTRGFVSKVRDDNKLDIRLQPSGLKGRGDLADQILGKLRDEGGRLEVTAKSSSEEINALFGVSRKKFKVALGLLYKRKEIVTDEDSISLPDSPRDSF